MKFSLPVLLAALAAATFAIAAAAMPAGDGPRNGPGAYPMDCAKAKAKDKARCESLNKDIEACRDKTGDEWRECMHRPAPAGTFTPPKARDCAHAGNRERCVAHTDALEACKDKTTRVEHRKCITAKLSPPGKS